MSVVASDLRPSRSGRISQAVQVALAAYAPEIDGDDALRAIRLEVRVKPGGEVRAVIVERQSEFVDR